MNIPELNDISKNIRFELVKMSHYGKAPHLGSSLSCIDLILACYFSFLSIDPKKPNVADRDRFILSKGHAVASLYATLAYKGFFSEDLLSSFNHNESALPEHPTPNCIAGVEISSGSLGHGLSVGTGMALGLNMNQVPSKVVVLMSDGECNEGSVWEAAMFAPSQKLSNLVAIIDYNKWQATGRSNEVLALSPLKEKWEAFGWNVFEIDGHNYNEILTTFDKIPNQMGKPTAIIAHTIKGKGISFMEDDNNWHYKIPTEEHLEQARVELGLESELIRQE